MAALPLDCPICYTGESGSGVARQVKWMKISVLLTSRPKCISIRPTLKVSVPISPLDLSDA